MRHLFISCCFLINVLGASEQPPVLPSDIKTEIIGHIIRTSPIEQAVQSLKSLNGVDKEWHTYFKQNYFTIIMLVADRYTLSPLLSALYVGTGPAVEWFNQGVMTASNNEVSQALDQAVALSADEAIIAGERSWNYTE
jgi:hypothetical protein